MPRAHRGPAPSRADHTAQRTKASTSRIAEALPGFVRVEEHRGATVLIVPGYPGNNPFSTLRNLQRYARVGLSFPDFARGDWLALCGRAERVWDGAELASYAAAQRLGRMTVQLGCVLPGRLPFEWSERESAKSA